MERNIFPFRRNKYYNALHKNTSVATSTESNLQYHSSELTQTQGNQWDQIMNMIETPPNPDTTGTIDDQLPSLDELMGFITNSRATTMSTHTQTDEAVNIHEQYQSQRPISNYVCLCFRNIII